MTTTTLTDNQKAVLAYMDERGLGAIRFEGRYYFPVDIAARADVAAAIVKTFKL